MSLEKKFEKIIDDANYEKLNNAPKQCAEICDEFAIGFAEWLKFPNQRNEFLNETQSTTELLEIYKQTL